MLDRAARTSLGFLVAALGAVTPLRGQGEAPGQIQVPRRVFDSAQTDVLLLRDGDAITGEFKSLQRGIVTFSTDAMSTVSVKWPRVLTAWTRKTFEIRLDDGRIYVGSMAGADSGRVVIQADGDTIPVATETIVGMVRLKRTFFQRLDGNINLGVDFTQQNAKVDINMSGAVRYDIPLNHFALSINASFSRQDSIADITRRDFSLFYSRELTKADWFWAVTGGTQENSQLGLQSAVAIGTGPGRFFVQSNRVELAMWVAPTIRLENYENASPRTAYPLAFVGDFQLFSWAGLSTDLSSRLSVAPVLNDSGRWQVNFTISVNRELVNKVYLTLGLTETYDSKPPSNTNKNDFSLTSSLGWTF